ncbi:hypothetical protein E2542_SST27946 [Spatholobus suberectus]|nr:hypothetical protein E2542_SST27946 [Spatholobus suberectus]
MSCYYIKQVWAYAYPKISYKSLPKAVTLFPSQQPPRLRISFMPLCQIPISHQDLPDIPPKKGLHLLGIKVYCSMTTPQLYRSFNILLLLVLHTISVDFIF